VNVSQVRWCTGLCLHHRNRAVSVEGYEVDVVGLESHGHFECNASEGKCRAAGR
jgi:hypothetical protein